MPMPSPIPDELDKPFWDACNQGQLVIQICTNCNRLQHPPEQTCGQCGSGVYLQWHQVSGRGRIFSYGVVYDTPITMLAADQPFNLAVIALEEDPDIRMLAHLPGTPLGRVPVGAKVEVIFETSPKTSQKVPDWRVIS